MTSIRKVVRRRANDPGRGITARGTVFQVKREDSSTSRQIDFYDEWSALASGQSIIIPTPYSVTDLYSLIERNSTLKPCIDAYVTNTVGVGWEIDSLYRGQKMKAAEEIELSSFLENPNSEESLISVLSEVIRDRESVGFGFIECIRDAAKNLSLLRHAPAYYTRLCPKYTVPVLVEYKISRGRRVSYVKEYRTFRTYTQLVGGRQVYFKEWGDPRRVNRDTGLFEGQRGYKPGADATEILHIRLPSVEPYGIPRWITQTPNVIGARKAEEVNMNYFEENTVPPMMLTVAGGRLTRASFSELNNLLASNSIGRDRQNKIMLIEAVSDGDSLDKNGTPVQLKVEKLADTRQSDSLFSGYDRDSRAKTRQAWRLPAIVIGDTEDANYASAQIALYVVDSQVFAPGRWEIDEILNKNIFNSAHGLGLESVRVNSRTPAISSPDTTIKALTAINVMGGVTPRAAIMMANTVLQQELPAYPKPGDEGYEDWMDKPLVLSRQGGKTHVEQQSKPGSVKDVEEDGNPGFRRPENGHEVTDPSE